MSRAKGESEVRLVRSREFTVWYESEYMISLKPKCPLVCYQRTQDRWHIRNSELDVWLCSRLAQRLVLEPVRKSNFWDDTVWSIISSRTYVS
jgi:hypothetical protein